MKPTIGKEARVAGARRALHAAVAWSLVALIGCSGSTSSSFTESGPGTKPGSAKSMLMRVRAAGQVGNELDVQPLRDPQVEDLRGAATLAENKGNYAAAHSALARALLITPDDPDLLQWQGELALVARNWVQAEQLATRSFAKGPKLGGLCRRNWTTIQLASQARGKAAQATQAQQRIATCTVAPPTRM